jgi:RHS repeat-associated protein
VLEQPFRFQGQQFDEETGLHYNRYRYYDPGVGRFVSQDPIGLWGGTNLLTYVHNPLTWIDPLGLARIPQSVKNKVAKENEDFFGQQTCECCGTEVVPGQKSQRGVTPPQNERQFDHIEPDAHGGANNEANTQILCRSCNRGFSDNEKPDFKSLNRLGRNPCQ